MVMFINVLLRPKNNATLSSFHQSMSQEVLRTQFCCPIPEPRQPCSHFVVGCKPNRRECNSKEAAACVKSYQANHIKSREDILKVSIIKGQLSNFVPYK